MELNELRELIINTDDEYWHQLIVGPYFHDRVTNDGNEFTGTSHSHYCRAVLRSDVNVALEWGLEHGDDDDSAGRPWSNFPDKRVNSIFVDVFYLGALVDRTILVNVDGSRAYLPNYRTVRIDGGDPYDFDNAEYQHQVSRWDYLLAQLLNQLSGRSEYESYFARSGLVRV